jgi:hypothetical protein
MDTPDDDAPTEYPPPPPSSREGRGFTIAAFVCALAALLIIPILFGPAGIALGVIGERKGDRLGRTAWILAIVGMVVGIAFAIAVSGSADDALGA